MKFALRNLAKSPGFTLVAFLMLALGIGVSSSTFSMANVFLLRQLPFPNADRLVQVTSTNGQQRQRGSAPGNLYDVKESATSFEGLAMLNGDTYALGEPGQPAERVTMLLVSPDFLPVIGVQPEIGRNFAADENQPGKPGVVILSHRSWTSRYNADPAVIGTSIRLNEQPYTVIGVMPESFNAPLVWGPVDFMVPRSLYTGIRTQRTGTWLQGIGRLKPGVSVARAQKELDVIAAGLIKGFPKENALLGLNVASLHDANMDIASRSMLWLMTALSVTMLVIACANLASLQVARAFGRSREFAMRAALGGSRRQLMVPLLLESLLLSLAGGAGGLLVALWINDLIGKCLIVDNTAGFAIPFDQNVFVFTAVCSILAGFAFGLAPAWISSRTSAADILRESSRSSTASRSQRRIKSALIITELALASALIGVAAAFGVGVKSFMNRPLGWQLDGLFAGSFAIPASRSTPTHDRQFQQALLERLAAIPGVQHAALTTNLPVFNFGSSAAVVVEGRAREAQGKEPWAEQIFVSPDYFAATAIPLRQGAAFSPKLTEKDPPVAIVNEAFARQFWPGANPLGRRVQLGTASEWVEIVGVVGDVQLLGRMDNPPTRFQVYRPLVQSSSRYLMIAVRATQPPETLTKEVRAAVAALDPDLPVANAGSYRAFVDHLFSNLDLVIVNLAISATMGLLISAIGVFGVISQFAHQRTRDIGVRLALGAAYRDIMRLVLGEGARLLVLGLGIGVVGYFGLTNVLRHFLPSVAFPGGSMLVATLALISATMLLACWIPARRATRVDPVVALRAD